MNLAAGAALEDLQRETFGYFVHETNPANGLVVDKTAPDWPASIAATGLALACYPVAVERSFISRTAAVERTLTTLRFLWHSPHGPEPDATGYQGFYYHFLDMHTGRRAWQCELSTVDSTFLLAGALAAAMYFDADSADEKELRTLADALYRRGNWPWAQDGGSTVTHGWKPESGFLRHRWEGYDEALLLYVLGLGSPTWPLPEPSYAAWAVTASLPFAPEIVLPTINHCIYQAKLTRFNSYGFKASFNPSHPGESGNPYGWWVSPWHFGLNQGPIVLMIENHRSGLLWRLMRACPSVADGLLRAGFTGGWLQDKVGTDPGTSNGSHPPSRRDDENECD